MGWNAEHHPGLFLFFNPNAEVADGGGADEATPECARPRAQQLGYLQATEYFQTVRLSHVAAAGTAALR
jgi:hypothetical protein